MATIVNVHEAKSTLSRLLQRVEAGERIVIARSGRPVADLVPHHRVDVVFGVAAGRLDYDDEAFDRVDPELVSLFEER